MSVFNARNESCDLTGETGFYNDVKEYELQPLIREHLQRCRLKRVELEELILVSKFIIKRRHIKKSDNLTEKEVVIWNEGIKDLENVAKNFQERSRRVCEEIDRLKRNLM